MELHVIGCLRDSGRSGGDVLEVMGRGFVAIVACSGGERRRGSLGGMNSGRRTVCASEKVGLDLLTVVRVDGEYS